MDGGMIPKVALRIHAVGNAVGSAHVLDGRIAHVLLLEVFTDQARGNHGHAMTSSSALVRGLRGRGTHGLVTP